MVSCLLAMHLEPPDRIKYVVMVDCYPGGHLLFCSEHCFFFFTLFDEIDMVIRKKKEKKLKILIRIHEQSRD